MPEAENTSSDVPSHPTLLLTVLSVTLVPSESDPLDLDQGSGRSAETRKLDFRLYNGRQKDGVHTQSHPPTVLALFESDVHGSSFQLDVPRRCGVKMAGNSTPLPSLQQTDEVTAALCWPNATDDDVIGAPT